MPEPDWDAGTELAYERQQDRLREWETTDEEEAAFRAEFGYALNDPKHPTYHERMSDVWDNRDKTERLP